MPIRFKDIWRGLFQRSQFDEGIKGNEEILEREIGWNIYGAKGTWKDFQTRYNRYHHWFKYRFFHPLLYVAKKLIGRWLVKELPTAPEYEKLKIFNIAYDKAMSDLHYVFLWEVHGKKHCTKEEWEKRYPLSKHYDWLDTLRRFYNTNQCNDTAYLFFHDALMMHITNEMNKRYQGTYGEILYTSKGVNDISYYVATRCGNAFKLEELDGTKDTKAKD